MSFDIPSFVPRQVSETLRAMAGRGFQSPLNVALATAIPLIALYSTIPALSSGALSKPKIHPSLETLVVSENSRLSKLKKQASEVYPSDIYGPGHTVELTKGRVKYWLIGPEDGKRVVLIHGLSLPSLIWKHVVARLVKTGFRVLIYDLYGRGYTEAPDVQTTPYNTELYITQLALLMQCVGWRKARIVGLSMGGAIAAAFAAKFPWLVETNVVLIASVGVMESVPAGLLTYIFGSATIQRLRHSVIGQLLFTPAPPPSIQSTLSASERLAKRLQVIFALQSALLPGYTAAVAASVFLGPLRGLEKEFEKLGKLRHIKVQLIWGAKDEIVPYKYAGKIQKFIPGAELVTIDDAGHDLCVTHSDIVADNLIDFLRR